MIPVVDGLCDDSHLEAAQSQFERLATHVEQAVRLTAHALGARPASQLVEEDLPPLFLLRHMASHGWALARVARAGLFEPTETLLRSMLEALVGVEYMLAANRVERARAYMVCAWHTSMQAHEMFDPSTNRGKQHQAAMQKDKFAGTMKSPVSVAEVQKVIASKRQLLSKAPYAVIESERKRVKSQTGRNPHWYSLYGGPKTFRELAREVGAEGLYDILYASYSERIHAVGAMDALMNAGGAGTIRHLLDPTGIERSVTLAVSLLLHASNTFVECFGDKAAQVKHGYHYFAHIRDTQLAIAGKKLFTMTYNTKADPA